VRTRAIALSGLIALGLLCGCSTLSAEQRAAAQRDREQVAAVVHEFCALIQEKSASGLRDLLVPSMPGGRAETFEFQLTASSWLMCYSGLKPDVEAAVAKVGIGAMRDGRARLVIRATNYRGQRVRIPITALRERDKWWIADFEMTPALPGDRLDPPEEVRRQLREQTIPVITSMKQGHMADVYYMLPDKARCRYRPPKAGFFTRMLERPKSMPIYSDLVIMSKMDIMSWPDTSLPLDVRYLSPGLIAVCYQLPYRWAPTEQSGPEMLDMKVLFLRQDGLWSLDTIRLSAKPIPYS